VIPGPWATAESKRDCALAGMNGIAAKPLQPMILFDETAKVLRE